MLSALKHTALAAVAGIAALSGLPSKAAAYPIDCAILLCLSGGWPGSAVCSAAKAEFIRRITPFPVEPPLQIWRCPMGGNVSLQTAPVEPLQSLRYSIDYGPGGRLPDAPAVPAVLRGLEDGTVDPMQFLQYVRSADIDISGPEFDFVRSIRVYHVRLNQMHRGGSDGYCHSHGSVRVGSYGTQGDYYWHGGGIESLPAVYVGEEGFGAANCPGIYERAVLVEWRDYQGNYGWERVDY